MRKIIGFKLALRIKEIQRRAKKAKLDLDALGLGEVELQTVLDKAAHSLKPAVLFETFPSADPEQARLSPMPGLAYSLILATLGEGFNAPIETAQAVWPIVTEVALEDAVAFATRLLQEDAEKDSCELSPLSPLPETANLQTALDKLSAAKIGVSLRDGQVFPAASRLISLSWLSKIKAKGKTK